MPCLRAPLLPVAALSAVVSLVGCASMGTVSDDAPVLNDLATLDLSASVGADMTPGMGADLLGGGDTPDFAGQPAGEGLFPPGSAWNTPIDKAMPDPQSGAIITGLQAAGGWGNGDRFQIDFSLLLLEADANTPTRTFTRTGDFFSPDCDYAPVPVPPGGALEGEADYHCASDGDCHLIVIDRPHRKLYEMWRADIVGQVFNGGCLAVWDMNRVYPANGRGEGCTSADAAGFSIAALLPHADEVWAAVQKQGSLDHALRFILPNARIAQHIYVHPATHSTGPTAGRVGMTPPYGAHFRLRSNYPLQSLPSEAARVIARTLQTYGMFVSDGGNIALTFEEDRFRTHKWAQMNFDERSMFGIRVTDFDMVDGGMRYNLGDCTRN